MTLEQAKAILKTIPKTQEEIVAFKKALDIVLKASIRAPQ